MPSEIDPPARPRRERPLVAPGRERTTPTPDDTTPTEPETMVTPQRPSVDSPPTGRPVFEMTEMVPGERADHVVVSFEGPMVQRRWTIALRFFLALPHYVVFIAIAIAAQLAVIIAWFAALFTKRVPPGLSDFLRQATEYQARVSAYGILLLSDRYPPFGFDDEEHAVNLRVQTGEFNRAAVFFRGIIAIPAYVVTQIVLQGVFIVMVLGWLLALVLGRLPTPLWQANAAVVRFITHTYAYWFLLTAEYPRRLFGDKPTPFGGPDEDFVPDLPGSPLLKRLVLTGSAKALIAFFLVIGVFGQIGSFASASFSGLGNLNAYEDLIAVQEPLIEAIEVFDDGAQVCAATSGGVPCLRNLSASLAPAFDTFADNVALVELPAGYDSEETLGFLVDEARDCAEAVRRMSTAESPAAYGAAYDQYQSELAELREEFEFVADDLYF